MGKNMESEQQAGDYWGVYEGFLRCTPEVVPQKDLPNIALI